MNVDENGWKWMWLIYDWYITDADADADAVTISSNTRSVPSSPGRNGYLDNAQMEGVWI